MSQGAPKPFPARPEGDDRNLPWPAVFRVYPADHPARSDESLGTPCNEDWAREDFGGRFIEKLKTVQNKFSGDWWALALLIRCIESARINDPHGECGERFAIWLEFFRSLDQNEVPIHLEYASLVCADLQYAFFEAAHLENAFLELANLERASLWYAHLEYADLWAANLKNADIRHANLTHAYLKLAKIEHATLESAQIRHTDLEHARLEHADLRSADFKHANLKHVSLVEVDVRGATGITFDQNPVRGMRIEGNAPDPWSQLRRKYTGPWFFVHAALLIAFILPYIAKVIALTAADQAARQVEGYVDTGERVSAFLVLIGWTEAWYLTLFASILLVYNALRAALTMRVGMLRDAEERSGVTPALGEYMGTQGLDDEPLWMALWISTRDLFRWLATCARRGIEVGAWEFLSRFVAVTQAERESIRPKALTFEDIGYWRLHRTMGVLVFFAILSFLWGTIHWIATTTVPVFN